MQPVPAGGLLASLAQVPDPRGLQGRRHPLPALLAAVVCAVLCGFKGYRAIAQWVRLQEPETWHWLGFKRRPACANCFRDLLMAISPEALEAALGEWTGGLCDRKVSDEPLRATSIDGKTLCGALQLLKDLVLKGRVIIGDAMFCQREVCQQIVDSGGHYLMLVKENQPTMLREIEAAFANEAAFSPLRRPRVS